MNNKITISILVLFLIGIVIAGVSLFSFPYSPNSPPKANDSESSVEGIKEVVDANNKFAFDLYNEINKEVKSENVFYSPYSISSALAMTYEGAREQTAEEMKEVFYFPEREILRPNFAAIYNEINKGEKDYELKTGNALWLQKDYLFLEEYLNSVENYYGGRAVNLDFIKDAEGSRQTINDFIEEQTNDKIKDLIEEGVLDIMTRMVLTNAIYFKGTWEFEFDKKDTLEMDFRISEDNVVKTDMMYMKPDKARFNYADLENLKVLELPYKGDEISMMIILPKNEESFDFENGQRVKYNYTLEDVDFNYENLNLWKGQMRETKLDRIYLPKFEFDSKYSMREVLSDLGMPTAFDELSADFSGMTGEKDLFISEVIHQAYVKVDEKGTEAAAATAVDMRGTSSGRENVFIADHPFVFIIQEKENGNILFMGRVINPNS